MWEGAELQTVEGICRLTDVLEAVVSTRPFAPHGVHRPLELMVGQVVASRQDPNLFQGRGHSGPVLPALAVGEAKPVHFPDHVQAWSLHSLLFLLGCHFPFLILDEKGISLSKLPLTELEKDE